ncbi:MAG: hypothetical protein U9R79_09365 [Armatimonadota bacterium]|nr:hypothetical protein [Armatimonadota bacterium]
MRCVRERAVPVALRHVLFLVVRLGLCIAGSLSLSAFGDEADTRPLTQPRQAEQTTPEAPIPLYVVSMMHAEDKQFFRNNRHALLTHARGLRELTGLFAAHGARLAFQPDWTFVEGVAKWEPELFDWLLEHGMGLDAHTHGTTFTLEEVAEQIRACVSDAEWRVRVGNGDFDRPRPRRANMFWPFARPWGADRTPYFDAVCAYKNPQTGVSDSAAVVWRPALHGDWHRHRSRVPLLYIGGGPLGALRHDFSVLSQALETGLSHRRRGCINVLYWHDSLHNYHSTPATAHRLQQWETALTNTFDPLVAQGKKIRWAAFSEIVDGYLELEGSPDFALQDGEVIEQISGPSNTPTSMQPLHP